MFHAFPHCIDAATATTTPRMYAADMPCEGPICANLRHCRRTAFCSPPRCLAHIRTYYLCPTWLRVCHPHARSQLPPYASAARLPRLATPTRNSHIPSPPCSLCAGHRQSQSFCLKGCLQQGVELTLCALLLRATGWRRHLQNICPVPPTATPGTHANLHPLPHNPNPQ